MRDMEAAHETTARMRVRARSIASGLVVGALVGSCVAIALAPPRGARFEAREPWHVVAPGPQDWPREPHPGERVRVEHDRAAIVQHPRDGRLAGAEPAGQAQKEHAAFTRCGPRGA